MRKDYQQLFRLFFILFVLNLVMAPVCLAEERRQDSTTKDIISPDILGGHDLSNICILGQPSTTVLWPILTIYNEIINYSQWVAFINISNTYDLKNNVSFKSSASAGYSKHEEMALIPNCDGRIAPKMDNYGSLYDDAISFSLPIAVTESLSIIPTLTYAFPFNNDSRNYLRSKGIVSPLDKSNSFVYGGLSVSYSF